MWIPELARARPSQAFSLRWVVSAEAVPRDPESVVPAAAGRLGVEVLADGPHRWTVIVPWQTLVYGFIRRDVDESAELALVRSETHWELRLDALPLHTHAAHAAGAGGAVAMAAAAWLIGGWTGGILPGLTVLVGAGLWVDATRAVALGALEGRLRGLISELGLELWPHTPAELVPPPR